MSAQQTLIHYFIPEDFDDEREPNAFFIRKAIHDISLGDLRKAFPVHGEYLFRFKYRYNKNLVWIDLGGETSKVPTF
jgi:hypothetical protein